MPSALVTGVAGFIGSNLTETLLHRGYTVRGIDTYTTGRQSNLDSFIDHPNFSFTECDIRDEACVSEVMTDIDTVFHQAAVASVPQSVDDPVTSTEVNCTGTAVLIDQARRRDVETLVVASSSSVYGSGEELPKVESMATNPESPYALSKYYTEQMAIQAGELYDFNTVGLRYFNIFGPRQDPQGEYAGVVPKFIQLMINGERPHIYGDGEQSRDFCHVKNVVEANILAAENNISGEVFNVASGGRVTINKLVETLNDLLNTDVEPVYRNPRPGDVRHSMADISKAEQMLGYKVEVEFEQGLNRIIDWLRTQ